MRLIWIIFKRTDCGKLNAMTMVSPRARLLAAVVALAIAWPMLPSTAQSDVGAPDHVDVIAIDGDSFNMTGVDAAPCGGLDQHGSRGACYGSASAACCPACVLVPAEPATFRPPATQAFAATLAEAAVGIVPGRLKRPPRPA